ncbi:hypothetical protein [Oceanobacillus massiliensis]|uniref:hypothetical protein n=1 Tax=Oceanobacillus massiliensis TaxID=1465765 RepID=UPI0002EB8685|nr:hypothetical protein [Oceanobacillus massiliensis]
MNENDRRVLSELTIKVKQQEDTITQLLGILAATNRKIAEISLKMEEKGFYWP